ALAVAILAWLVPPATIDYQVKFYLGLFAFGLIFFAMVLLIIANKFGQRKQAAIDELSEEISWAIHHIVNMPKLPQESWDDYAVRFTKDYNAWCERVDRRLQNKAVFTQSDLLHFQRLGIIQQVRLTGHQATDHAFSMINLKLDRLREIIVLAQQRSR